MFLVVFVCIIALTKSYNLPLPVRYIYNPHISEIAVNLSQASYCVSSPSNWTCATCDETNYLDSVIQKYGERCLIGYNTELESLFVSFRGSSDPLNWIDDFQISKVSPYNDTKIEVEKGFYKVYEHIRSAVLEVLDELKTQYSTKKLLLTGHSLGAATTTLMAFDVMNEYDVMLYTFGSPRVGNKYFVESFENQINMFRITHYCDIVPHVSPEFLDYLHLPQEIWYNEENNNYYMCKIDYTEEDDECSNSCLLSAYSTSDHLNYLNIAMGGTTGLC